MARTMWLRDHRQQICDHMSHTQHPQGKVRNEGQYWFSVWCCLIHSFNKTLLSATALQDSEL